jgi:hypothetical protein
MTSKKTIPAAEADNEAISDLGGAEVDAAAPATAGSAASAPPAADAPMPAGSPEIPAAPAAPDAVAPKPPIDILNLKVEKSCSRGLAGWLAANRMSLAITSNQSGRMYLVGSEKN